MVTVNELSAFSYSVALLFVVLLIKSLLIKLAPHQPLSGFNLYCRLLADKVNNLKRSPRQQQVAGFIAIVITLAPLITIIWLFSAFIEWQLLWHGCLLYLAIDGLELSKLSLTIAKAINEENKIKAKQLLATKVLRDTEHLSSLGLAKCCIEMQLLRSFQQLFTIALYFLVFGPLAALTVRLLLEMRYSWNLKKAQFKNFSVAIQFITDLLLWLPARLFSLITLVLTAAKSFSAIGHIIKVELLSRSNHIVLASFSYLIESKLGGVASYDDHKLRKVAFNELARQPEVTDIKKADQHIKRIYFFYMLVLLISALVIETI